MKDWVWVVTVLLGCGSAPHRATAASARAEVRAIAHVLDDWHRAAAQADEARYFSHLALVESPGARGREQPTRIEIADPTALVQPGL